MALRTANEERKFHSEKERRRWLREWLRSARKTEPFHRLPDEIDTLRQLLDRNLSVSIEDVLSTLLTNSAAADNCDLFRFRAALSAAMKKGWSTAVWGARPGKRCTWKPAYADNASASASSDRNLH
ncbi:hypothetical protein IHC78_001413 [Salmonella enterica subsp. houtenae]|nr:hypothetical protein [Salmonella enterica subsp. houtenae]